VAYGTPEEPRAKKAGADRIVAGMAVFEGKRDGKKVEPTV